MGKLSPMNLEELEDFYYNANDLMQSVTPDGHFRSVNNSWLKTLGYSKQEVAGMTIFDIIHMDEMKHCQELFMKVMSGEDIGLVTTIFVTKDGQAIFAEGNVNCNFMDGKPTYTRAIFRDITERKKVEEEREHLIKELKQTLAEVRTLSGLLPICAWCKQLRNDKGYWESVEQYIEAHSEAEFTHSICPDCMKKNFPNYND